MISVIIPCYNDGAFIDDAVDSVLAQTYEDFEIIIVNDGSTDPFTVKLLTNYDKPKTQVIHTKNQGPSVAKNIGIEAAKGKYILPLDADDKIEKTYLAKAAQILDENNAIGIVYCEAEFFGANEGKWNLPKYSLTKMLGQNVIFNSAFFRKSDWKKVNGYNPNMVYGMEDYDFWLSLIEHGVDVYQIPETLFYYRIRDYSRTTKLSEHNIDMFIQLFYNHQKLFVENIRILISKAVQPNLKSKLYINTGRGFNEKESVTYNNYVGLHQKLKLEFILPEYDKIKELRFDPVEGQWSKITLHEIIYQYSDGTEIKINPLYLRHNGQRQPDGSVLFHTSDPMFFLPGKENLKSIQITATFNLLGMGYIDKFIKNAKLR